MEWVQTPPPWWQISFFSWKNCRLVLPSVNVRVSPDFDFFSFAHSLKCVSRIISITYCKSHFYVFHEMHNIERCGNRKLHNCGQLVNIPGYFTSCLCFKYYNYKMYSTGLQRRGYKYRKYLPPQLNLCYFKHYQNRNA